MKEFFGSAGANYMTERHGAMQQTRSRKPEKTSAPREVWRCIWFRNRVSGFIETASRTEAWGLDFGVKGCRMVLLTEQRGVASGSTSL